MFPGPTLQAALTTTLESALNRALALDPAGRDALLEALTGTVQFRVGAPASMTLTLQRCQDQVRVGSVAVDDAVLELTGQPMAFAALALGDTSVFSGGRLVVTGDTALAHQFQRATEQLNPDWEAALADRIGDVPAHFLGQRLRAAVSWSRQASEALRANLEEYIHEESGSLPGRNELEATFDDIDAVSLQTERLAARIQRLVAGLSPTDQASNPTSPEQP